MHDLGMIALSSVRTAADELQLFEKQSLLNQDSFVIPPLAIVIAFDQEQP